jgi:probable phosphoglycerate mutase
MTSIVLIRHGETDWNVEGRYQGQADPTLNRKGYKQAELLVQKLNDIQLDIIYTSPLRRAKQTAEVVAEKNCLPIVDEPRFMEINQGDWQTRLRADIERTYPELFSKWETKPWEVTPPNGEHLSEVKERVLAGLYDAVRLHPEKNIGIVTHRIPIALIKMKFQSLDPDIVRTIQLPNTYFEEINIDLFSEGL